MDIVARAIVAARARAVEPLSDEACEAIVHRARERVAMGKVRALRLRIGIGVAVPIVALTAYLLRPHPRPNSDPSTPTVRRVAPPAPSSDPAPAAPPVRTEAPRLAAAPAPDYRVEEEGDAVTEFHVAESPDHTLVTVTLQTGGILCTVPHREGRRFVVVAGPVHIDEVAARIHVLRSTRDVLMRVDDGTVHYSGCGAGPLRSGELRATQSRRCAEPSTPPRPSFDALLRAADEAQARSEFARASELLTQAIRWYPAHPDRSAAEQHLERLRLRRLSPASEGNPRVLWK